MNLCKNCGEKLYESNEFCTNCGSQVAIDTKNISPTPTRMEIKKHRAKKKRFVVVGSIIGLLLVIGVASIVGKELHKPVPKSNVVATMTVDHPKDKAVEKKNESPNNSKSEEGSKESPSSNYILPDSDKRVLSLDNIDTMPKSKLRLARNEIYARHGYVFQSQDLQKYFSSKSWYDPKPSYNGSLNEAEKQNIALIKAREDSL